MSIYIKKAILHVLNNDGCESYISTQELDIDSDVCTEFITKHAKKLMNNPNTNEATFNPESKVYEIIQAYKNGDKHFKDASCEISDILLNIMKENVDIPSGDVLITHFTYREDDFIAILKLNYKECFTHQVENDENGTDAQIVKYRTVLPFDNGKVEEACLIPYNPMVIKLLDKPYLVNGEQTNYFSQLFLDCAKELSKKEAAQIINEVTEEINQKFFNNNIETMAKMKAALVEEAFEEEGIVSIENVAARVFAENQDIKNEYINLAKESGIKTDIDFGEKYTVQQFGVQRFKANNGIEIKFPAELSEDPEIIEIINNADGSVSIMLKNLRKSDK